MQKLDGARAAGFQVTMIIFPNWREMLNQAPLNEAARGGYALKS